MTTKFNTVVTETANDILGKHRWKTKPLATEGILDMCDTRRDLKNNKNTESGAVTYGKICKEIRKGMSKAKEDWIEKKCTEVDENLNKNNSKKTFQLLKNLTRQKQSRVSTIQDKQGSCLTEEKDITNRWTEYCKELYSHQANGNPMCLLARNLNEDNFPILQEEVETAIRSLKNGKSAFTDNIPAELIKNGGEAVIDILTTICNKIWQNRRAKSYNSRNFCKHHSPVKAAECS